MLAGVDGCATWSSLGASASALFADGASAAVTAAASCAQPGKAVNSRTLGAWCYCANKSTTTAGTPPNTPADPDHPLDGDTFGMFNIYNSEDLWVSFTFTAGPPGEPGVGEYLRATYASQSDAMPIRFESVPGKPHTYLLFNEWPGYQHYIAGVDTGDWLRADFNKSHAMAVELVPAGQGVGDGEYVMVDTSSGLYISFCVSSCDSGKWLKAAYADRSDAMVVKLVPMGPPITNPWGYCTSTNGTPEQINVQLGGEPTAVVLAFVTFEATAPEDAPLSRITTTTPGSWIEHTGVTHVHTTAAKDRTYYMHFVRVSNLTPRERYYYQVKSNGQSSTSNWSTTFSFRAGYATGETKVAIWGDMGVYEVRRS